MASTPYARVAHLLDIDQSNLPSWQRTPSWRKDGTQTPTTLTAGPFGLSSYALTIAYKQGDTWYVYDHKNSATTNRHLSAVRGVLEGQGYQATDETITGPWDRYAIYRVYRKEE